MAGTDVDGSERQVRHFFHTALGSLDDLATRWLTRYSIPMLRVSLGLVFLAFGLLKFIPNLSPAEDLARQTIDALTLGLVPGSVGIILVAALESAIGLSLVSGRHVRLGLVLLGVAMIGILAPLALFPNELFREQDLYAPTLKGQYVFKDVVLVSSGLVIAARERGGRMIVSDEE